MDIFGIEQVLTYTRTIITESVGPIADLQNEKLYPLDDLTFMMWHV
jgi:hypothetical protein